MTIDDRIIEEEATSLKEYIVLPGRTSKKCTPDKINLEQKIFGIFFRFPIMPASMSCLYHGEEHKLALKSSKEGMPPVIHYNQPINDQVNIIETIKKETIPKGSIELKENFISVNYKDSLEEVLKVSKKFGHSVIPILDRFSNLYGVFIKPFYEITEDPETPISKLGEPIYYKKEKLVTGHIDMTEQEIKRELKKLENPKQEENDLRQTFLPILDNQGRLKKLAFIQKFKAYQCGAAISTHEDWEERAKACIDAKTDFIVIDTSEGHSDFEIDVAKKFKKKYPDIPLVGGNIVTADAFNDLKKYVDIIKVGLMTGGSCKTGAVKNIGCPLSTALKDVRKARDIYAEKGKYIPIIADGGIFNPIDMTVALKFADLMMAGKYFAQFFESAGEAFDKDKNPTTDENLMKEGYKEYWGEGSNKAKNLLRYGHVTAKTSLEEGVYGLVPYRGRLKPCVEEDFKAVSATLSNAGCMNLKEYREKAILQRLSPTAMKERYPSSDIENK